MPPHLRHVLCVDDDEDTCQMLSGLFSLIDCHTTTAATPAQALELIARERFDLYLLDNWLPGGGGVELCREIRRADTSTPVVFYSGAGLDAEREEALVAGAQAYLVKPGEIALLVETVRRLLRDPQLPGEV